MSPQDPPNPNSSPPRTVAIVLGSGGVLGASFHAGVLLALQQTWGIDGRRVDELLGTSAGAVASSLLAAGMSPADLLRREQGLPLSEEGQRIMARRGDRSNQPRQAPVAALGPPPAPGLLWAALRSPGTVMPGSVMAGLLPRGHNSTDPIANTVGAVLDGQWPTSPCLRIATVKLASGRRHIFTGEDHISPGPVVAAACAVPAIHRPVTIGSDEYIDGATHSANNVDAVGPHDLVIVSSPMTSAIGFGRIGWWTPTRQAARLQLDQELTTLAETTRVVVLEPDREVIEAMGPDLMRTSHRAAVALSAHRTATAQLNAIPAPDLHHPPAAPNGPTS